MPGYPREENLQQQPWEAGHSSQLWLVALAFSVSVSGALMDRAGRGVFFAGGGRGGAISASSQAWWAEGRLVAEINIASLVVGVIHDMMSNIVHVEETACL